MQPWSPLPISVGRHRRRDGIALAPWHLHEHRLVNDPDEHHAAWGNASELVLEGGVPAVRTFEGWLVAFPSWRAPAERGLTDEAPRFVLGRRTLDAAREYIDRRFPLADWWLDVDHAFGGRPFVRVV